MTEYVKRMKQEKILVETIEFSELSHHSEPSNFVNLKGFRLEYHEDKGKLFLFPTNSRGQSNPLRWSSVHKKDIPLLIASLSNILKEI